MLATHTLSTKQGRAHLLGGKMSVCTSALQVPLGQRGGYNVFKYECKSLS